MNFYRKYSGYIGFGALLTGMIICGIGWDKYDSTLQERTDGAVFMIITGIALIIGGLTTLAFNTKR